MNAVTRRDDEQLFTMRAVVDTHRRFMDLLVVYTNDPVWVEHSIHIMELLLVEEKYKVVGFDLDDNPRSCRVSSQGHRRPNVHAPPRPRLPLIPGHKAL